MLARTSTVSALARQSVARTFFNSANVAGQVAVDEEFPGVPASHPTAPKHGKTDVSVTASGIKIGSDNSEPLVTTLGVQLAAGSRVETDENAGLSQLFAKLAFRATDARSDLRLFRDIEAIGGVVHKEAGRDFVRYAVSVLPHHADAAAQILAETTLAPRFAQWDIDAQKKQVIAELDVLAVNPAAVVLEGLHAAAFYDDATLGRPIVTTDNLASYTSADLWAFYDQFVNTTSAAVIGTGIEHSELSNLANEHFSGLGLSKGTPAARTPAKYVGGESRVKTPSSTTHVALGFEAVGKLDPLYGSVHVLRALLSGRVNPKQATAFFASYGEVGVVGVAGHAADADVGALIESFAAEMKSLATTPVSKDELAVAKTVAALDAYNTMATRQGMLSRVGLLGLHQVPAPSPLDLANSATPESIQALAKKALASRPSLASVGKVSAVPRVDALAAKLQ